MSDLIKQIEELTLRCDSSTLLPVILQVEQLTKERDEARREVCEFEKYCLKEAARRGWDCFKETP
jgi:hypothetical protein